MSFLKNLLAGFSGKPAAASQDTRADRVAAILAEIRSRALPCLRLGAGGSGRSRLGGVPEMTGTWPRCEGRPLTPVAQLDLEEVRTAGGPDWLPASGRLLFFYDFEHSGWGIGPEDLGSFVVRWETDAAAPAATPPDLKDGLFEDYPMMFAPAESLPDAERLEIDWRQLSGKQERVLKAALEAMAPPEPAHQIGGYPSPIQGDGMEKECQANTRGLRPADDASEASVADWRLLLQLDTDNAAGMMWGDTGRIYFWIREQDARAGDFDKAWMIVQCY
jgi:uncharacterized protein YwqG